MNCQCCKTVMAVDPDEWAYAICRECCWEQEPGCEEWPDCDVNPNNISLNDAKVNYSRIGACDSHGVWMKTGKYPQGAN